MNMTIRLNQQELNQFKELKEYYSKIFGEQTNVWVIKQTIFQEWLKNVEIPKHNKTTG